MKNTILLCFCLCLGLVSSVGCKTTESGSAPKFGWEEDLAKDPVTGGPLNPLPPPPPAGPTLDKGFCGPDDAGTCLSLIIRIPAPSLVNDLGLSTLTLGDQSKDMALRMQEACSASWTDYQSRYQNDFFQTRRRILAQKITKMRCVFLTMSGEYVIDDTKLGDHEIGLSVRLTKFAIQGSNRSTKLGVLELAADSTQVTTDFRSLQTYVGKKVGMGSGTWKPVPGAPLGVIASKETMGQTIKWNISTEEVKAELNKIDFKTAPAAADAATQAFFGQAKAALGSVGAAATPVGASMVLIGMGFNAYKQLCGEDSTRCKTELKTTMETEKVAAGIKEVVPTSDALEAFRLALTRSVQGILNKSLDTLADEQMREFTLIE